MQDRVVSAEGQDYSGIICLENILCDSHMRHLMLAESMEDESSAAANVDAQTSDPIVLMDAEANMLELKEKLAGLKLQRLRAEINLRNHAEFPTFNSLIATMLDAEREVLFLREVLGEVEAEYDLVLNTLNSCGDHVQLRLSKEIHTEDIPAEDGGRRCEMCDMGFPASEQIVSPCGHFYHIFCLAIRVAITPDCCRATCREPFAPCWMLNFGFPRDVHSESGTVSSLYSIGVLLTLMCLCLL